MSEKARVTGLMDESPLLVYPSLARALGNVNKAIIVQQLHFLMNVAQKGRNHYVEIDERWWVYNSYDEWRAYFSWLSKGAIQRLFLEMEKDGYIVSRQGVKNPRDRRKWYTIDYEAWARVVVPKIESSDPSHDHNLAPSHDHNLRSSMITNCDHDLSENTLQREILAPDGAGATSGNGETSQEVQLARALFSAVASHVYGIDGEDANGAGGRIGKISNWLAGKYAGRGENKVGQISHPASPEHVARFAAWYKSEHPGVTLPRDFVKFVESWRAWATAQRATKPQRVTYTQEELDAMAREMMRERYGIDQ